MQNFVKIGHIIVKILQFFNLQDSGPHHLKFSNFWSREDVMRVMCTII